jgi:hypothetical protein
VEQVTARTRPDGYASESVAIRVRLVVTGKTRMTQKHEDIERRWRCQRSKSPSL